MKRYLLLLFLIVAVSCTGNFDPWGNDPYGQNNQESGYNDKEDTTPTASGITVDDEATSDDNVANTKFEGKISVYYNESTASVSGSVNGVSVKVNGARVTATNSGDKCVEYVLSGSSSDGFFKLYSSKKQAIVLNGLSLTNTKGAAINNQSKKRTFVVVEGTNSLRDGSVNSSGNYPEEVADEDMKAAFFSEGQLVFSGPGSLSVTAVGKAGITSDDYVRFMTGSTVSVSSSAGHGVRGKDAIIVSGGTVKVTLDASATAKKCFTTDSLMFIGGGITTLVNKASAGTVDSELTGAAGIKADQVFVMRGGELSVEASGKGCKCISGDKNGYFEGGKVTAKATGANYGSSGNNKNPFGGSGSSSDNSVSSKAIKFDGNLEISGGEITASCSSHEAIESKGTIYISGGRIFATSSDDAINSSSTMTISDGFVYAYSTGNDGLDANGNLIIKGGVVYAVGSGSPEVGIDANTEGRFRLYIEGGTVIALGGLESGSSVSNPAVSGSWTRNSTYSLCEGDNALLTFKTPASGGSGIVITSPSLVKGNTYKLKANPSLNGQTVFVEDLLWNGGTAEGGVFSSLTAGEYTSSGMGGGGGFGPGGGGPGGFGW